MKKIKTQLIIRVETIYSSKDFTRIIRRNLQVISNVFIYLFILDDVFIYKNT